MIRDFKERVGNMSVYAMYRFYYFNTDCLYTEA